MNSRSLNGRRLNSRSRNSRSRNSRSRNSRSRNSRSLGWSASLLVALCAISLFAGAAAAQGPDVRVQRIIPFAPGSGAPAKVIDECDLQTRVPAFLGDASTRVELVDGQTGTRGRVLDLEIASVRAPGGGVFSGRKWLTVTGSLRENGREIGSFTAARHSVGGVTGVFGGTCGILGRAAQAIAHDIAVWLDAPTKAARLGDA